MGNNGRSIVIAAACAGALLLNVGAAAAAQTNLLFVQEAGGGTLTKVGKQSYRLRLDNPNKSVATFTDRPKRDASQERLGSFVNKWKARGFTSDPPNGALVLQGGKTSRDVMMLTLSHPTYRPSDNTLSYVGRPLKGKAGGSLSSFDRRSDSIKPVKFGAASLFIDDGGDQSFQPITLQVSNVSPGHSVKLQILSPGIVWSMGSSGLGTSRGFNVVSETGNLSTVNVSSNQLMLTTSSNGGSTTNYGLSLFLAVDSGLDFVTLQSNSDPGISINAVTATPDGPFFGQIGSTPTPFPLIQY